jgi:hypothetical protein
LEPSIRHASQLVGEMKFLCGEVQFKDRGIGGCGGGGFTGRSNLVVGKTLFGRKMVLNPVPTNFLSLKFSKTANGGGGSSPGAGPGPKCTGFQ